MVKTKRVAGKTWKKCNGAPALWCEQGGRRRLNNMQLEGLRERIKKRKR